MLPREIVVPHPKKRSRPGWMGLVEGVVAHGTEDDL